MPNRRTFMAAAIAAAISIGVVTASAQAPATPPNPVGLLRFDHMSINVMDFEKSVTWYRDVLGLEVDVSWRVAALDGKRLAYLSLAGVRVLEIVAADANGTGLRPAATFAQHFARLGYGHLCFATDDVDRTMAALEARGVSVLVQAETYPLDGTIFSRRVAFVTDPEGNVIEFGEPLVRGR